MPQNTDLLVADIGGTNARFAISDGEGALQELRVLHAAKFPKIEEAVAAYFAELKRPRPTQACFAVACPAKGPEIKLTNSSWRFVKEELRQTFPVRALRGHQRFRGAGGLGADPERRRSWRSCGPALPIPAPSAW